MCDLAGMIEQARSAWPSLRVDSLGFAHHVVDKLVEQDGQSRPLPSLLKELHAADLYLAYGCSVSDSAALRAFEQHYGRDIVLLSRKLHGPAHSLEDLGQILREKLFVRTERRDPKIADFQAIGSLRHWLRVTALRTFLDVKKGSAKRRQTEVGVEAAHLELLQDQEVAGGAADFELAFLKEHYRKELKMAFEQATSELTSQERNILRHQVVDLLNIDQIAAVYGIHRSTAARRLTKARERLLKLTRLHLKANLTTDHGEIESILNLVRSNLNLSLRRVFGSPKRSP